MNYEERKSLVRSYLGRTVDIVIDRPLGSAHPKYPKTVYKVNYGYVPNTVSGDGEPIDVYLLGVNKPVERYRGRVIGIVHRRRDREDKLVAAPVGMELHQAQIEAAVRFTEKYFHHYVEALNEKSCGAVVYTILDGKPHYLLINSRDGYCGFPKGHMELGENEVKTAVREIWEETSVKAEIVGSFRRETSYPIGRGRKKKVVYFLASFEDQEPCHNAGFENNELLLLPFEEAQARLTHKDAKNILAEANSLVLNTK